ncbi:MAG: TIM barrel protein [Clostridia bacterium]|nr:TIM barrel protein [Clostridia bacterium]
MKTYKQGLVSISFRDKTPLEILIAMKKCNLNYIEWGSDVHAPCNDKENLENIKKLQDEFNIICSSYGTYFRLGVNDTKELPDYINAAKNLGTDILRLWCGNKGSEEYTNDEKNILFEECKKASRIAEKHNVKLCMECHNNTYTDTKEGAFELMEYVNSPAFRMYWQPNQFKTFDENISYAKLLSLYTEHIHVFNWDGKNKYPLNNAIDTWKTYLSCFGEDKTLLLEFMPDDKIESLKTEADSLFKITE